MGKVHDDRLAEGSGFFYTRFPEPGTVPAGDEHYFATIFFHRLGDGPSGDVRVLERPDDREMVPTAAVSDDGRWLVVTGFKGASDKSKVYVAPISDRAIGG